MIEKLRMKMKTLALLDAIIEQEWQYRYFSYQSNWSKSEEVGSLRDGCGGEWFLWFSGDIAAYKCWSPSDGLMHNLQRTKDNASDVFSKFITEPAFNMKWTTCIWFLENSQWVKYGKEVHGLVDLQAIMNWSANDYHTWATEYYERDLSLQDLEKIFDGEFSKSLARSINPDLAMDKLLIELPKIGIDVLKGE